MSKKFYIFGHNIQYTLSPTIHNAGFAAFNLPHTYLVNDVPTLDKTDTASLLASASFGGASVTVPHKLAIIPFLDSVSAAATTIGAVNTVLVDEDETGTRTLRGENTDYVGIRDSVLESLSDPSSHIASALVIGAGGSARAAIYALYSLGVDVVYIYNRTNSKAQEISDVFASLVKVIVVDSLDPQSWPQQEYLPVRVIVGNVPGDAMTEDAFPSSLFSIDGCDEGVLVEMAYKPDVTPLMKVAEKVGGWKVVRGTDVLLGQGYEQFRLWTRIDAPKKIMSEALKKEVERRSTAL
ncbi:uncharacterized protein V2V93DRAFT_371708 [Kockiozyma suomiensis]|uniref:uncharacterized protein n=1 Tax=Kockiozyma suomiensis TaxID=1337062 RepID=UPI003344115C